jgi:hypothetical protein
MQAGDIRLCAQIGLLDEEGHTLYLDCFPGASPSTSGSLVSLYLLSHTIASHTITLQPLSRPHPC